MDKKWPSLDLRTARVVYELLDAAVIRSGLLRV